VNVLFPNLLFEETLAGRRIKAQDPLRWTVAELAPAMGLLGRSGDVVVVPPDGVPQDLPECLSHVRYLTTDTPPLYQCLRSDDSVNVIPWGWDAQAREFASRISPQSGPVPSPRSVEMVNGRAFSARFDVIHGDSDLAVFDQRFGYLCESPNEFAAAVSRLQDHGFSQWIAKPPLSNAARNRLIANSTRLNSQQRSWLDKQMKGNGYIYLEPWIVPERECGLQFEIRRNSAETAPDVVFQGMAELINDRWGRYRGSLLLPAPDSFWQPAIDHGLKICRTASQTGYFGPVGIDCMQIRLPDGRCGLRLCNDINGRLTMGRLALVLGNCLGSHEWGGWLHTTGANSSGSADSEGFFSLADPQDVVRRVRVSPRRVSGRLVQTGSQLIVVNSRRAADRMIHGLRGDDPHQK